MKYKSVLFVSVKKNIKISMMYYIWISIFNLTNSRFSHSFVLYYKWRKKWEKNIIGSITYINILSWLLNINRMDKNVFWIFVLEVLKLKSPRFNKFSLLKIETFWYKKELYTTCILESKQTYRKQIVVENDFSPQFRHF